jgi:ribosomal protein S12 methylthiotransferase
VAAGCLAERYGSGLAEAMPEAQILSFDDYEDISSRLDAVLAGERWAAHEPRDRRTLLPLSPVARAGSTAVRQPGHGVIADLPPGVAPASGPRVLRRRLGGGVVAPLKIASGCDRRCTFCAIPAFRGAFVSRRPEDLITEAGWLADHGARELLLVSENSTSYGKDLGDLRLLETLLPRLAAVPGIGRVRVSYLQPAEVRPGLVEVLAGTDGVAPYFDLSFQHASGRVLRSMRRFGDHDRFCELLEQIRRLAPEAGVRSNFIVGFPGETDEDLATLQQFLEGARLDAIGIFGYSDEDGTEAAGLPGKLPEDEVARRVSDLAWLADELMAQRAAERVGESADILVEEILADGRFGGRAAHQAPEVDGTVELTGPAEVKPGDLISATITGSDGVDLVAEAAGRRPPGAR